MPEPSFTNIENRELISIIVPVYKVEKYIKRCLDSIIHQTYTNIEIILVDDGTPDQSGFICEKYSQTDKRFQVYHKTNGGLSDARNFGIERAHGEYVVCVDSDDYVDYDYIEYLYSLLKKHQTLVSICQHRTIYDNGSIRDFGSSGDELLECSDCLERMLYHDVIDTSAWAKMYHRSLFDKVKYPKGKIFEDIGTTYALLLQCDRIAVGYEAKYNYIFHNNSIVNGQFSIKKFDMLEMTDKMAKDVVLAFPTLQEAILRRKVYARFSTINQMLYKECEYESEWREMIRFIRTNATRILRNNKAPRRDKIAIIMILTSYKFYRWCWASYQKKIMGKPIKED